MSCWLAVGGIVAFPMRIFHSARNIHHREQYKDKSLYRAGEKSQEHNQNGSQKWEKIVQQPDDQFFGEDVAEKSDAE